MKSYEVSISLDIEAKDEDEAIRKFKMQVMQSSPDDFEVDDLSEE